MSGLIRLVRPHNIAAAVLSVAAGAAVAGAPVGDWRLYAAVAIAVSAGYTVNDLFDVDIDRINKPNRPIPSGAVSPRAVWILYVVQIAALCALIPSLTPAVGAWLATWIPLLFLYSAGLKRRYLAGNVLVSAVASSSFLLGAFAGGRISAGLLPAAFSFFFMLSRELVKDVEDLEGDRACGARTVPVVSGPGAAVTAAAVLLALLIAAFPVPYIAGVYGRWYGVIVLAAVEPILVLSLVLSVRGRSFRSVSMMLKTGMFFGIMAFYFGAAG